MAANSESKPKVTKLTVQLWAEDSEGKRILVRETDSPEIVPCPNCGRPTHRTCLMNGGTCCSECYDSMDEEY